MTTKGEKKRTSSDIKVHKLEASQRSLCVCNCDYVRAVTSLLDSSHSYLHFEKCSVRNRKGDVICREAGGDCSDVGSLMRWNLAKGYLTSSTVFLLFVSLSVSSTKLSQRPLQSSGSSVKAAVFVFSALMFDVWS